MTTIQQIFFENYQKTSRMWQSWYGRGKMNFEVAEFLLKKYNSSNKRFLLSANESINSDSSQRKKRRINPYHLTLYSYILMFFGLSLECYLKGSLIKNGKEPVSRDKNNTPCLHKDFCSHNLLKYFKEVFNKEPELEQKESLRNLQRCIESGKYPIEKSANNCNASTAYLERDIKNSKRIIKRLLK